MGAHAVVVPGTILVALLAMPLQRILAEVRRDINGVSENPIRKLISGGNINV